MALTTLPTAAFATGSVGTSQLADGAVTTEKLKADVNFRNLIINGDMSIAQRGTSVTGQTGSGFTTVDRVRIATGAGCTFTISQATDAPTGQGFTKSYKVEATTGDASLGSGEYNFPVVMYFEGQNLQLLKFGTSSAESVTISFWVKATVTGTYILELRNDDNARYVSKSYTINSSNTWEKKTITIDGDTIQGFDNDNGRSLSLNFWGGAGSDYSSGTLQTAWTSNTDANRAVGQVNAFASNNDVWQITGLQLEAGTTASDFEFLPYDVNLQRCMRYYEILQATDTYDTILATWNRNTSDMGATLNYKVIKRAEPSFSFSSGNTFRMNTATGDHTASSISSSNPTIYTAQINIIASGTPLTAGQAGYINMENGNGDAIIRMDAEL